MSAAAAQRFLASVSVDRACACGAVFTVRRGERRILCMSCMATAAELAAERRRENALRIEAAREERAAMRCDECATTLLAPAALCGLCDPDFDLEAALVALDSATPNGRRSR